MGKGDKKSKRGKIILGSFGVRRRRKAGKTIHAKAASAPVEAETVKQAKTATKSTKPKAAKPAHETAPKAAPKAEKIEKTEEKTEVKTEKPVRKTATKKKE